jgi:hypothetical protein
MGDPVKFRLVHGGGEVFHSHHPHGGTIRWLRQPKADGKESFLLTAAGDGPVKYPEVRTTSDRVDVQVIGPSEVLDLQTECGSGLCQQLAGDFLFHCHVRITMSPGCGGIGGSTTRFSPAIIPMSVPISCPHCKNSLIARDA